MAKNDDDIAVTIDDPDTISVNVDDNPDLAAASDPKIKEPKTPKTRRVQPDVEIQSGPTPEQALEEARSFAKQQEEARRAAEATAANERAMREQAQRQAQQAQQEAEQNRERADNSELTIIESGITAAQGELEAQQNEYVRAAEAGEFAKMGQIQTKIAKAAAALDRLEAAKTNFSLTSQQKTTEGRVEAQPTVQPSVFDQFLSQFAPAAQSWLRQHPDCVPAQYGGDTVKNSKMMAGHYDALAKSIVPNTPEYFKVIEEHLGTGQQATSVQTGVSSKAAEIQTASAGDNQTQRVSPKHVQPSAPVTREPPASNGQQQRSTREVRLTKEQQEMAKVSFPHLPEAQAYGQYARNLLELESEGKIGRLTH